MVDLRRIVMDEIHKMPYFCNLRYLKTISRARKKYFWLAMKKDIIEYISKHMKCQRVKVENQHPVGLLQPLSIS